MRHHTAAERRDGTGWHYVDMGRTGGHPLGYCRDHGPHKTEQEARECYARYQRDHIRLDAELGNWMDCFVCGAATKQGARIEGDGYALVTLCAEHLTEEHAAAALHLEVVAGDAWVS